MTAYYTLETDTIAVLNKIELLSDKEIEDTKEAIKNPINISTRKPVNLREEMNIELLKALSAFFPPKRAPLISAKTGTEFEGILMILYEIKCACGDLT